MKKAVLLSILVVVMQLAAELIVDAQQPKKVPRIGYLVSNDPATESARSEGIRLALRELGYIEGQNIAIEYRYAEGKNDRHPKLAADPGAHEGDQDDSHRYGGQRERSCRGRLS
jgi:putative ABC transport system substrate-binding protein